jgi:hypothetical protein
VAADGVWRLRRKECAATQGLCPRDAPLRQEQPRQASRALSRWMPRTGSGYARSGPTQSLLRGGWLEGLAPASSGRRRAAPWQRRTRKDPPRSPFRRASPPVGGLHANALPPQRRPAARRPNPGRKRIRLTKIVSWISSIIPQASASSSLSAALTPPAPSQGKGPGLDRLGEYATQAK